MTLEDIVLHETNYGNGKGFSGNLYDLLQDVFELGKKNLELEFSDIDYANIDFISVTVKARI